MPRLAAALRELPPQLCEAEGSWQHGLLQGAHSSAATQLINPTTEVQLATIDQGAGERVEAVPAAERAAQRIMSRSSASLCFLGTGAMKPSAHRNVRPLLHAPCTCYARACTHTNTHACTRHAHAMHTPQVSALLLRLPPPSTSFMLREQLQFYFSPQNLPRDRFLLTQIAKSPQRCALEACFTPCANMPSAPCTPHTPSHPSHTPRRSTRSRSKCTRRPRTTRSSSRSTTRRCRSRAPYLTPRSWASSASAAARCTWASASGAACSTRRLALAAPPLPPLLAALGGATAGWLPRPPGTHGLGCGLRHATAPRHALQRSQPHLAP